MATRLRTLLGAVVLIAVFAAPGAARAEFITGIDETTLFTSPDATERNRWFDTTVDLNAGIVRINLSWSRLVTGRPANPGDPADPAYKLETIDAAVESAAQHDLDVLLTFFRAPIFAEGGARPASAVPGSWKPDPGALGEFARAVATRYSGSFEGLPRVRYFEAWNEPNVDYFLAPQTVGGQSFMPGHYRKMLNAVAEGVHSVHPDNAVIGPSTAPYGDAPGGSRTRPLTFMRELFCLDDGLDPVDCPTKPQLDLFSHHPINLSGGPRQSAIDPDDASTPDLKHAIEILRAAEKAGTIQSDRRRLPVWVTEIWWVKKLEEQARFVAESTYLLWKQGAEVVIQFMLRDSPKVEDLDSGLYFVDGSPKPSAASFRFPFVTDRKSKRTLFAWGKAPSRGKVRIQRLKKGDWSTIGKAKAGGDGVFTAKLRLRGSPSLRARSGRDVSPVWR